MTERHIFVDSYEHGRSVVPASPVFAKEGDILISSQYGKIDRDFLKYLSLLKSQSGKNVFPGLDDVVLLEPQGAGLTTARKALNDPLMIQNLRQHAKECGVNGIRCFAVASEMNPIDDSLAELARTVEIPLLSGNYEIFSKFGGKSKIRELFRELKLKIPEGVENVSPEQISKLLQNPGRLPLEGLWIKADWGAAGIRNIYVAPLAADAANEAFAKLRRSYEGGYVVERHVQNAVSFPGALIEVGKNLVMVQDVHEQSGVLISNIYKPDSADRKFYSKNPFYGPPFWWSNEHLRNKFLSEAKLIGEKLLELGWQGRICADAIVDRAFNIYWDEINFRDGGSALVIEAVRRLYDLSEEMGLEESGISFSVKHLKMRDLDFQGLVKKLRKNLGLNFDGTSLVILNAEFYGENGFDLVAFGKEITKDELDIKLRAAEEKIRKSII